MHLFDIDIPGGITFRESDTLTPGGAGTVVDTDAGRLGIGICYDLRFPELAMLYADRGAQLLVYPGASLFHTAGSIVQGFLHTLSSWHVSAGCEKCQLRCTPAAASGCWSSQVPKPDHVSALLQQTCNAVLSTVCLGTVSTSRMGISRRARARTCMQLLSMTHAACGAPSQGT